jgi:hypothetical protein
VNDNINTADVPVWEQVGEVLNSPTLKRFQNHQFSKLQQHINRMKVTSQVVLSCQSALSAKDITQLHDVLSESRRSDMDAKKNFLL